MITVTMKRNIGGTRDGVAWPAIGENISLPDHEAHHMVQAGYSTLAEATAKVPAPAPAEEEVEEEPVHPAAKGRK